jgi:hypothetical protein
MRGRIERRSRYTRRAKRVLVGESGEEVLGELANLET